VGNGYDVESSILCYRLIDIFRFLLVSLNIESILQESTIYRRREILSKMTEGLELGEVYGGMIDRIKAQGGDKSRLGIEALMWVSHAERSLRANELCHALAIEVGSVDFNAGNTPSITTLVSCCQGLVTVDNAVFAAVRGPRRARRGDCQEPGTGLLEMDHSRLLTTYIFSHSRRTRNGTTPTRNTSLPHTRSTTVSFLPSRN